MRTVNSRHPELAATITSLIEKGLNPDEIMSYFRSEDEKKLYKTTMNETEIFPDEIYLISQAFAYRSASKADALQIYDLLRQAYSAEIEGDESFRTGEPIELVTIQNLLEDESYQWVLVETPSGRDLEKDGSLIGLCCFSTTGLSRKNGIVEGHLGSIRLFGILPKYRGFCVGQRILSKIEDTMFNKAPFCCRSMVCIPSTRLSMLKWAERRGYQRVGAIPYPAEALGHTLKDSAISVDLVQLIKSRPSLLSSDSSADDKLPMVKTLVTTGTTIAPTERILQHTAATESRSNYSRDQISNLISGKTTESDLQTSFQLSAIVATDSLDSSDLKSNHARAKLTTEEELDTVD